MSQCPAIIRSGAKPKAFWRQATKVCHDRAPSVRVYAGSRFCNWNRALSGLPRVDALQSPFRGESIFCRFLPFPKFQSMFSSKNYINCCCTARTQTTPVFRAFELLYLTHSYYGLNLLMQVEAYMLTRQHTAGLRGQRVCSRSNMISFIQMQMMQPSSSHAARLSWRLQYWWGPSGWICYLSCNLV